MREYNNITILQAVWFCVLLAVQMTGCSDPNGNSNWDAATQSQLYHGYFYDYSSGQLDSQDAVFDRSDIFPEYSLDIDPSHDYEDDFSMLNYDHLDGSLPEESFHHYSSSALPVDSDHGSARHSLPSAVYDLINHDESTVWSREDLKGIEHALSNESIESQDQEQFEVQHSTSQEQEDNEADGSDRYILGDEATAYWRMLEQYPWVKTDLINVYCDITQVHGRPIQRNLAAKRLRARCNEGLGNDLLSGDAERIRAAKMELDRPTFRRQPFLRPMERGIVARVLTDRHDIPADFAPQLLKVGIKMLSVERKKHYNKIISKDFNTLSNLADDIYSAYFKLKDKRELAPLTSEDGNNPLMMALTPHDIVTKEQQRVDNIKELHRLPTSYWSKLPNDEKELILDKYTRLTGTDPQSGYYILDLRCSLNLATHLLSEDPNDVQYAITVLDKAYRKDDDLLTEEEKGLFYNHLFAMHNRQLESRFRIYSVGSRGLSEKARQDIREDIRMNSERFEPLTKLIVDSYKAVRKANRGKV